MRLFILVPDVFSVYYMVAYHDVGLSVLLISIVNVVFDVSESASELPTSVLFDRWSRERTLIIGVLCRVAGFILMLFWSANFAVLCLANVLAGIGAAVESGAASSLYIEYTRKHDPSLGMKTLVSRLSAMIGVCTICGGAVGAVLFLLDSQLIWLGATVFYVLAIIPLLGLMRAGSRTKAAATDGSGTTERQAEASVESDGSAEPGESGTSLTVLDHVRQTVAAAAVLLRKPEIWNMVVFNLGTLSVLTFWQLLLMGHQTGVWWQFAGLVFTVLRSFDRHCLEHGAVRLERGVVERWIAHRIDANPGGCRSWFSYIRDFGRWMRLAHDPDAYVLSDQWKAGSPRPTPYCVLSSWSRPFRRFF